MIHDFDGVLLNLPEWVTEFRPHQVQAVREILDHFDHRKVVMVDAPTGCIAGNALITYNRGGNAKTLPIKELVHKFNGGISLGGRGLSKQLAWDLGITTNVQCAVGGVMKLTPLRSAYASGTKLTYELLLSNGQSIRATKDHRFLTADGWVQLGMLDKGEAVKIVGAQGALGSTKTKNWYKLVNHLWTHPYAGRKGVAKGKGGFSVPLHRLVVEADMNDMGYDSYIALFRDRLTIDGLRFLDPVTQSVHHRNMDHHDNRLTNLMVVTPEEHGRLHAMNGQWKNVQFPVIDERVKSIREIGEEETFDLEVEHDEHNFVANGFVVHNSGKTLIGEMVRQVLMWRKLTNKGIYVCSSKTLQAQVLHDYPYARVIKGRSNYPTLDNPRAFDLRGDRHISAANCTKMRVEEGPVCSRCEDFPADIRYGPEDTEAFLHCHTCHPWQHCPYEVAKGSALDAKLTVANTAYFLTEANYVGRFGAQDSQINPWHSKLLIMDEADTIESIILGYVELSIPKRVLRELDLGVPKKVTVAESWLEWCDMAHKRINEHVTQLAGEVAQYHNAPPPTKLQDELDRWGKNLHQIAKVASSIRQEPEGWVLDGYQEGNVSFRPIEISSFARELLWRHSERFLLMSATLVSPRQMAADLGLQDHEWESVEVVSSFPVERRLVNVRGAAKMAFKTKDVEWPKLAEAIEDILDTYPNDRVLIHTVSYELTEFLMDKLWRHRDRLLSYSTSKEREQVLSTYRNKLGAVLLAPSLDRGVDLKDDDCRVVIVTKVPFPSLGDKRISQRLYGTRTGESWYAMQTVRSLVQMTGRAMRHENDYMTAYILDSQFIHITWKNALSRNMIPNWWAEALVWEAPKRRT